MNTHDPLVHAYETGIGIAPSGATAAVQAGNHLAATLPVWTLAAGSLTAVTAAANRLRAVRGLPATPIKLDPARVSTAFASDHVLRLAGEPVSAFGDLSGFFPTFDGWIRTHANYPHHRAALLSALGLPADASTDLAITHLAMNRASDLEDRAAEHGAIVVRVRTEEEWAQSEQGRAAATGPLVAMERRTDIGGDRVGLGTDPARPLHGLRVLDLTRVIAGPVATRALALLGADVLRLDPPKLPEIPLQFADTCQGKRSALLDLITDLDRFHELLAEADVLVTGYRPGALEFAGIDPSVRPGLIHARVSAWGESGPWGQRRGFDSIVQAAAGISVLEGAEVAPGTLPAQALDHATGYLLAAGVLDALALRTVDGSGRDVRAALARTASWLLAAPDRTPRHPAATPAAAELTITGGGATTARPAFAEYPEYPWPAPKYGSSPLEWAVALR
ncbi:CoA transferase [Nocardia sp. NPDC057227]|uniref:CoA transferase n=1 Tax=Nocardia sp. NPDC057227 TaxID=3346056 RepID=UPI003632E35F